MAAGRLSAEVVIKREDAMNFRARQVERLRDHGDGRLRDIAEGLLQRMQDNERGPFGRLVLSDDFSGARSAPWLISRCHPRFQSVFLLVSQDVESLQTSIKPSHE